MVWVGYDDNLPTGFTGSEGALPVWARITAGLGTTSWNVPMPDSLAEVLIEYPTGLRAVPGCASDIVTMAVHKRRGHPAAPGLWLPGGHDAAVRRHVRTRATVAAERCPLMRALIDIIPRMSLRNLSLRNLLPALIAAAGLAGCALFRAPPSEPAAATGGPATTNTPAGSAQPSAQPPPAPSPLTAVPPAPPSAPTPPKQFHLGPAPSALVTYAHQQAASGDTVGAAATLERALRIEPDNPLLWIELGRVRLAGEQPVAGRCHGT